MSFAGFPGPPIPPGPPGPPPVPDTHALLSSIHLDTTPTVAGIGKVIVSISGVWTGLAPGAELDHLVIVGGVPEWTAQVGSGLGDVTGPAGATDNAVARYNQSTGKIIQNSLVLIDDAGNLSTAGNILASGNLTVFGTTGLSGTLTVIGLTTLVDLDVTGNTTISGDLTVLGNVIATGLASGPTDLTASGFVVGPAFATDSAIAVFDGTTGKIIRNSALLTNGSGDLTLNNLTVLSGANLPAFDTLNVNPGGTSTLGTVISGLWNGDPITEVYGGTGRSSYTAGDILYSDATDSLAVLASGSEGQVLSIGGGALAWNTPSSAGGLAVSVVVVTAPVTTLGNNDYLAAVSGQGASQTINLPAAPTDGERHVVKDSVGVAGTGVISVDGNGFPINDSGSVPLVNDYEAISVIFSSALGQWQLV